MVFQYTISDKSPLAPYMTIDPKLCAYAYINANTPVTLALNRKTLPI